MFHFLFIKVFDVCVRLLTFQSYSTSKIIIKTSKSVSQVSLQMTLILLSVPPGPFLTFHFLYSCSAEIWFIPVSVLLVITKQSLAVVIYCTLEKNASNTLN